MRPHRQPPTRRHVLQRAGALAAWALAPWAGAARAQGEPIRVLSGFAAGGSVDALARMAAEALGQGMGRPGIVENKTGAAGRIALDTVKAAPPDGSVLAVAPQGPMTLFPYVFRNLRFDPQKDFTPIAITATGDFAITTGPLTGASSVAELQAWLKANPDKASFGSPGAGTLPHFVGLRIAEALGVKMTHVPYRGSALSMNDLAGGTIAAAVSPVTEALELHKAGRVRILATASAQRTPFVDGLPTLKELGHDIDVPLWFALYGPAGMPAELVARANKLIVDAMTTPAARQRIAALGLVPPPPMSSAQIVALRDRELAMWGPIVKASGFTPND
jgi:tripartite-type tricarboxylate transporter receptor subunit TctC